jgi:hypothetical protein
MHGGASGAVSGDDNGIGELDGETDGDDRVKWMGQGFAFTPTSSTCLSELNFIRLRRRPRALPVDECVSLD